MRRLLGIFVCAAVSLGAASSPCSAQSAPGSPQGMTFELRGNGGNCTGCEWIAAEGVITAQTPDDFRRFLQDHPEHQGTATNVVLHSPGGDLEGGLSLGARIREAGFWTSVGRTAPFPEMPQWHRTEPGSCMSACAYAFLGGVERSAESGSLGFHQFYHTDALDDPLGRNFTAQDLSDDQRLVGRVALYLKAVGADAEVLFIASATPPNEMYRPSQGEMRRLGIVTGGVVFSGWAIEPYAAGAVVTGSVRFHSHHEMQITVFCRRSAAGSVFVMGSSTTWAPSWSAAGQSRADVLKSAIGPVSLSIGGQVVREATGQQGLSDVRVDNEGRAYLTFAMSRDEFRRGLRDGFAVEAMLPRVLGATARIEPPRLGLSERASVALRVCL